MLATLMLVNRTTSARRPFAYLLLAATILASSLDGSSLPAAAAEAPSGGDRHYLRSVEPFEVTNPDDGTVLRGHVYLPDTPPGERVGTVLVSSPYWGTTREATDELARDDGTLAGRADWFLAEGYAYAAVNLRGTGESGGCVTFGGLPDQRDGYHVVEGLADQPWSDGKIGMFGLSFDGWSQYMALAAHPPSLEAIVPVSGVIDYWSVITRNGASYVSGPAAYPVFAGLTTTGLTRLLGGEEPHTRAEHFACPEYPPDAVENTSIVHNGDRSPYWEERSYLDEIADSDVAVFAVNGMRPTWVSPETASYGGEGHILQFESLWERLTPGKRRLLVGPWPHGYPILKGMSRAEANAWFRPMVLEWFDSYLRDASGGRPDAAAEAGQARDSGRQVGHLRAAGHPPRTFDKVLYVDDRQVSHDVTAWPPPADEVVLPLSGPELLRPGADAKAGQRTFQSSVHQLGTHDPDLRRCTPDYLTYASPPLSRDVHLAGNFVADVSVSSTLPDGNLAAFLYAIDGEEVCPSPDARELGRALTDLRHWKYTGYGSAFPVNTPTRIPLLSLPFATTVEAGQRIVLVVAGDATELFTDPRKPAITVTTGPDEGSWLRLPVIEGTFEFEQPRDDAAGSAEGAAPEARGGIVP